MSTSLKGCIARFHDGDTVYVLRGRDQLAGYVFQDEKHAREWITQPIMVGSRAYVAAVKVRRAEKACSCCEEYHLVPVGAETVFMRAPKEEKAPRT